MNQKGFTLIELIIVITIISILATIAIPRYTSFRSKAVKSVMENTYRLLYDSVEATHILCKNSEYIINDNKTFVIISSIPVQVNNNCYPTDTHEGVGNLIKLLKNDITFIEREGFAYKHRKVNECGITYKFDNNTAPTITLNIDDC